MSVPMSQYEALLEEVRLLRRRTQHVQQLADPLISNEERYDVQGKCQTLLSNNVTKSKTNLNPTMDSTDVEFLHETKPPDEFDQIDHENIPSEDECGRVSSTHMSVSSEPISQPTRGRASLYHGTWPVERTTTMWNSEPTNLGPMTNNLTAIRMDQTSVMSFASSSGGAPLDRVLSSPDHSRRSSQQLEAKMDMVYSLLAMLGGQEHADMGETLLALSTSPESCLAMRQSGCIPLLVQLVQSDKDADSRKKASEALHNLVHSQPDEKLRKRETRVLKLLEQARLYTEALKNNTEFIPDPSISSGDDTASDKHPVATIAHLMKHSFDEGHRQAICQLGGIYVIANLVENEHSIHGSTNEDGQCILMRRYACMALTNLTFGDSGNKALLCSFREFMRALVVQLQSPSDELRQVTASVLRNLSWRADSVSKEILKEVGTVTGLMKAAMVDSKENTLKSILSALWNLSAHCTENKAEICAIDGALGFLVDMLSYKTPSKSLAVIENSGGILRNISSQIAVREDYREILRKHNCLQVLLEQLKSPSLTIVSNACGTLWNLSAKNGQDQESLWQMGAPAMLRSLNHSKHKMIAMGSSAALKNLLSSRPSHSLLPQMDATAKAMDLPVLPTLGARKQKALLQDLDQNLRETYDNLESPKDFKKTFLKEKKDEDLCHAFSSINLNETSSNSYFHQKTFSGGSSSLPYTTQKRLKRIEDETDSNDQPIDFSRKYSEKQDNLKQKKYVTTSYAETDLDQPTDYSLRYAEDDSDSEIPKNEYVQDTVKTYCTEGTPLNFSTATSMSDLRIEKIDNEKTSQNSSSIQKEENVIDEKDRCSTEDISEIETARKSEKLQFNSGLMSPEKPVNYCEEGTPGYFSRVSSFGSLTSIPANENLKGKTGQDKERISQNVSQEDETKREIIPNENQKAVKFEQTVNYAEETPLMFSRSSSLASLDSFEQHSIHDDRSSIVSEISRFTSGVVSPDIPDSPSQTMPPSPRPRKVLEYPSTSRAAILFQRTAADGRPQPAPRSIQKPSIFEDNVTKFKEESTPVQFSTATSLSSLTIDEHEDRNLTLPKVSPPTSQNSGSTLSANATNVNVEEKVKQNDEKKDVEPEKPANISSDSEIHISENEGDEDILADCINIGMQNRRHKEVEPVQATPGAKSYNYPLKRPASGSGIPLPRRFGQNNGSGDTVKTYCTEDTPAILSHAGSQSDLSILSSPNEKKNNSNVKDYTSDDSGSNLSGDNENILAECIQSGMPKAKPKHNNSKIFNKVTPDNNYLDGKDRKLTYLIAKDEVEKFAVENSPCQFSLRSSLSDLTVDGSVAGLASMKPASSNNQQKPINNSNLSGQESLSSLSVDSVGSVENEQALLEQCISSGMPKSKSSESSQHPDTEQKDPKNAPAASAVASIPHQLEFEQIHDHRPAPPPITAGEDESDAGRSHATRDEPLKTPPATEQVLIEPKKSGCEKENVEEKIENEKIVNRMLDPDAMIESLDRFTAELVLQAQSRMEKEKDLQNSVTDGGETWTDISPNDVSFPSISGSVPQVITFSDDYARKEANFTTDMSTLTESTLIAIEATRIATTFQMEAAMAHSTGPFELDMIQPPSHLNSLTSSINELDFNKTKRSPKLTVRKKSLPNLMIRKALTNSLNQATSFESLENRSISNLDHVNPPSILGDVELLDLEGSMISVASLQSEAEDVKTDFLINGFVSENRQNSHPMFNVKVPYSEIENVNPPSIFNEITDICNSLADAQTEAMGTETEIFEDCITHLDNDATLFSDANSSTPLESDLSSNDSTPKKQRKMLTPKERRNLSKDRYKTYTIDLQASEDYVTCTSGTPPRSSPKMTAREKRLNNRSRFETQVIDESILKNFESSSSKETISETSTLTSTCITESTLNGNCSQSNIRKNFIQKRLENRDRFKTKVITDNSSAVMLITSPNSPDLHYLLQKEANTVLKTLNETKTKVDELLECETLSLVSNEEDSSEQNSGGSNYRTYHKSWGLNQPHIPVVDQQSTDDTIKTKELDSFEIENIENSESSDFEGEVKPGKPKIVKPEDVVEKDEEKVKAIRGHRKSLYHRNVKTTPPSKIVSPTPISNKMSPTNKNLVTKTTPPKNVNKTPLTNSKLIKPSTKSTNIPTQKNNFITSKPPQQQSPIKSNSPKQHSNSTSTKSPNLERQGTFVKEEKPKTVSGIPKSAPSKIPSTSNIPKPSKIARATPPPPPKSIPKPQKTPPLNNQEKPKTFYRSPSVDAKDVTKRSSLQPSTSSQSLKNGGVVKRSSMPESTNQQRNGSNGSLASNGSNSKQITSKIASLWKRVEESKKQSNKTIDKRVWIQPEQQKLIRSNTFDNKDELHGNQDSGKRISRLGSFVVVEGEPNV
ncbi:uro-adherence factor A-like isoform X1 [Onthophagus taurus]|uniref:uro-adherence factor A-like isoform X1 n=2 Tax=Onthophagus taurus TaxID=166361 RepID=UPI0039BE0507